MTQTVINRRRFLSTAALAGAALAAPGLVLGAKPQPFKLKYAPHAGLFENSAGDDIVDQVHYAADLGFAAWEDNGMRGRSIDKQNAIAAAIQERGM